MPGSRLLLVAPAIEQVADQLHQRFAGQGIDSSRIECLGKRLFPDYLALHNQVDINLDAYPYTGGTTTCHSLWMGVPVITLTDDTATSRGGASLLGVMGLDELIADTPEQYIDTAVALSANLERLALLRRELRSRMRSSRLTDGETFTSRAGKGIPAGMACVVSCIAGNTHDLMISEDPLKLVPHAAEQYRVGNLDGAEKVCRRALKLAPNLLPARHLLGVILHADGRLAEAAACYREVVRHQNGNKDAIYNLGVVLRLQGDSAGALEAFRKALEIDPGYAPALNMVGVLLQDEAKYTAAMAYYNRALDRDAGLADAHWNRALLLLLLGDTERGWKEYEWRRKKSDPIVASSLGISRCSGNNLTGRVVWVGREQGVGDQVMFAAGIPRLLMLASGCILNCDERLVPLFSRSFPGARVVSDQEAVANLDSITREVDCELPFGSLPGMFADGQDSRGRR